MKIGDRIKYFRKKKKLTQDELSNKCGISRNALSNYELNKRTPPINVIMKMANVLGIPSTQLLTEKIDLVSQEIIENALNKGYTLETLSKNADIPLQQLNAMFEAKPDYTILDFVKLYTFFDIDKNKIDELIDDAYNFSEKQPTTSSQNDLMEPINKLIDFLKSDNYPVDKLNNQTLSYIYEKITDLLEFEFYKLEKNNFNITDKKRK
ncbi:helix-turn-helix domain-containing protein [Clostridium sp. B9]|uniref:helix-turn-helix domain-containing protein n=1 Tax=Clostridium sp. B9 TaxID=3423224 RepID=UPI003D2F24BD